MTSSLFDAIQTYDPNNMPKERRQCPTHGYFESVNYLATIWSKCPKCCAAEDEQRQSREDRARRDAETELWERKVGLAAIPPRFQDRTLETYVVENEGQRRALQFAQQYVEQFDQSLKTGRSALFLGSPGTGKTHIAVGIAQALMRQRRSALFLPVLRAIRRIKDSWRRESQESETEAVASLVFPDLLILDEIGVQFGSDTERNLLFDVLNERYESYKPVILISNLPLQEVKPYLGERVFSRLRESGGESLVFDWEDHRGK